VFHGKLNFRFLNPKTEFSSSAAIMTPRVTSPSQPLPASGVPQLLLPRWIVPIEPYGVVLTDAALLVADGKIVELGDRLAMLSRHPDAHRVELAEHCLLPGLVNLHCHAAMTLLRGLADDLALMTWLNEHIWPKEGRYVDDRFVFDGSRLAFAEALLSGTTTVNDMYFFPEAAARAALATGIRCALGINIIEFPTRYAHDADEYIAKGLAARSAFLGEPTLTWTLAPHAPYTISDPTWRRVVTLAEELEVPIHTHIHETADEIAGSLKEYRVRPLERLANLGVVSPRLISVHSVHYDNEEIDYVARHGVHIAHCPASNLKLASGIAPIAAMLAVGVNVGIGTDGAASNNRLDLLAEMRLAALLAKGASGDATAFSAHAALRAVTLGGAQALGLAHAIGSVVPGKAADLIAIRLDDLIVQPVYDPVSHLVYAASREHVSHVWVGGEARVWEHRPITFDPEAITVDIRSWQSRIASA
jgi:5-methylthioadenosine/S-adenosylhomocysteine deaminase